MTNLFKPKIPDAPAAPAPQPPAPLPDADSPAAREARRRSEFNMLNRAGRASTILTAPDRRGGDTYSGTRLGAA